MKSRSVHRPSATFEPASAASLADPIADLKKSIGHRLTREFRKCVPVVVIRRALDDAAEIARDTDFPHLFFPALAEEKVRLISAVLCEEAAPAELLHSAA